MDLMKLGTDMLLSKLAGGSGNSDNAMSALTGLLGGGEDGPDLGSIVSKMQGQGGGLADPGKIFDEEVSACHKAGKSHSYRFRFTHDHPCDIVQYLFRIFHDLPCKRSFFFNGIFAKIIKIDFLIAILGLYWQKT